MNKTEFKTRIRTLARLNEQIGITLRIIDRYPDTPRYRDHLYKLVSWRNQVQDSINGIDITKIIQDIKKAV